MSVRRRQRSAFDRIERLRRRLKVDPTPFGPLPLFKPWSRRRWYELRDELMLAEAAAAEDLERLVADLEGHAIAGEEAAKLLTKPKPS